MADGIKRRIITDGVHKRTIFGLGVQMTSLLYFFKCVPFQPLFKNNGKKEVFRKLASVKFRLARRRGGGGVFIPGGITVHVVFTYLSRSLL